MIPLLAFAATIELQCADVDKFMENVESVRIVHMTKNQKKEVREALESFVTDTRADLDMAYDWVCEMTGIYHICDDVAMWDQFFDAYYDAADWELINDVYESV